MDITVLITQKLTLLDINLIHLTPIISSIHFSISIIPTHFFMRSTIWKARKTPLNIPTILLQVRLKTSQNPHQTV
jgi:hypothetical protein